MITNIDVRVAKVKDLEPVVVSQQDAVDKAIDKFMFSAKSLLALFVLTLTILMGIWGTWNLKNTLKIDLMAGPHHEMIDEVNQAFGI